VVPGSPRPASRRAPLLNEHTAEIAAELSGSLDPRRVSSPAGPAIDSHSAVSKRGKPFSLSGVRVIDLSWIVASGGAGRFLTALGAEVIKVEHLSRVDGLRYGSAPVPPGGRAERDAAAGPLWRTLDRGDPNQCGTFMEINAGKRSLSLNLKTDEGKRILADLIRGADMVVEGFSPGTMDRMGFGYARLQELNPAIIYVQQSGLGQIGSNGRMRTYGPVAAAFSGISEMSGLPAPYPPAGIGYSFLDWFGAYNMATAILAALYRRRVTGEGCWIDASQVECGTYLTGTAVLDFVCNGRRWERYGNRSPYKLAAPHGAYRTKGTDRWIAIGCFSDLEWQRLLEVMNHVDWASDARFDNVEQRANNSDALDELMTAATRSWDGYELMTALQAAGVPAGVCQTAEDRVDVDPQLRHDEWLVELDQRDIGRWPVKELPIRLERTPAYIGGTLDRSGPSYGEDNEYVLRQLLRLDEQTVARLAESGIL
jgi:crotonobetainyl-CoA:carnitine CoA-transferase CaiB-like acyl-CoA transferase